MFASPRCSKYFYPTNLYLLPCFFSVPSSNLLLLWFRSLAHYFFTSRINMKEERFFRLNVYTVCKPTPVVRIRVRRSVIRIRISETAIRIRIVVRTPNDTARKETVHHFIFLRRAVSLTSDRSVFRFPVFPHNYSTKIIFLPLEGLKASRPPLPAFELEEALLAYA